MRQAIDVSNNDYPIDMACLKSHGVEGVIIGCQIPQYARVQARDAQANGLPILGTYAFLWDVETPEIRTRKAIEVALGFGVERVWLDVEYGDNMPGTLRERQADVRNSVAMVREAGRVPAIYTGQPFWTGEMGNTSEWWDLALWLSNYGTNDPNTPRSPITTVSFGGWSKVAIHQYSSVIPLCGRDVRDWNYVLEEEDDMSAEDKALLQQLVTRTYGSVAAMEALTDNAPLATRVNTLETNHELDGRVAALEGRPDVLASMAAGEFTISGKVTLS